MAADSPLPPELERTTELDDAWRVANHGDRLAAVRRAARRLKDRIVASGRAVSVSTYAISSLPYPARFGLSGADRGLTPHVIMKNRMQLVQVDAGGRIVNILVNPTDPHRAQAAPFIRKQLDRYPRLVADWLRARLVHSDVATALRSAGVAPEDIDYITFDHLHVQDVRGLLGTVEPEPGRDAPTPALLPNAKLLVQRPEVDLFRNLHPMQRYWYVENCLAGVSPDKIVLLDGDYLLGAGFAIVRTPGHTDGNHSLVVHTDTGVWTISENGIAVECYAPEHSDNPRLRAYARHYDVEVILNGNTRERSNDQYTSMILEKTLADPSVARPEFPQTFPSSELQASPLAPGIRPTFEHGEIRHGVIQPKVPAAAGDRAASM